MHGSARARSTDSSAPISASASSARLRSAGSFEARVARSAVERASAVFAPCSSRENAHAHDRVVFLFVRLREHVHRPVVAERRQTVDHARAQSFRRRAYPGSRPARRGQRGGIGLGSPVVSFFACGRRRCRVTGAGRCNVRLRNTTSDRDATAKITRASRSEPVRHSAPPPLTAIAGRRGYLERVTKRSHDFTQRFVE